MVVYENKKEILEYLRISVLEEGIVHCHKEYEIVVCRSGRVKATVNKTDYILEPGQLFIVYPYQLHTYKNISEGDYRLFIFSSDYLIGAKKLNSKENLYDYSKSKSICHLLSALDENSKVDMYDLSEKYAEMLLVGYINVMMHELILSLNMESGTGNMRMEQRLIEYCINNCSKPISLQSVADELLISSTKISKVLKDNLGISFPGFINSLRVANACQLLSNSELNMTEISIEVGFESIRNFNRVFNKFMGISPADYRKKQLKNPKIARVPLI